MRRRRRPWHGAASRSSCGAARQPLRRFITAKLADYADLRSDPSLDIQSHLSPYLHFGQIPPLEVALAVSDAAAPRDARDAFLEELLVRRELSANFAFYNERYDSYDGLPAWARATRSALGVVIPVSAWLLPSAARLCRVRLRRGKPPGANPGTRPEQPLRA